ncbi:MAG TPA: biotin--[acetyl-CoA-carboxylase] ligase [Bryobacteraceae bacterium]|nr:biotin--[acetyl-CoA-carboxylase] ligase [Bryobacteraceae bacterium]
MSFDIEVVSEGLHGRVMVWLAETASTMRDAARLAAAGCASGTVVGAEFQTAGQGRHGKSWHSEPGSGLYFSVVLRLPLPPEHLPVMTMTAGLAVAEAIVNVSGIAVDLRWPNDILIQDKKVCGILIQQQDNALICGVGLNVNHSSFPPDIAPVATSLRLAAGREFSRESLLMEALNAIDRHADILLQQGTSAILKLFSQSSSYVYGRRVVVEQGEAPLRGTTDGLDANGFLYLRQDNGARKLILAGGVRPE